MEFEARGSGDLDIDLASHNLVQPFSCSLCPQTFERCTYRFPDNQTEIELQCGRIEEKEKEMERDKQRQTYKKYEIQQKEKSEKDAEEEESVRERESYLVIIVIGKKQTFVFTYPFLSKTTLKCLFSVRRT